MPRIAQASKQAVLESRQRGGSFATAFWWLIMAISYPLATPTNKTIQQVAFFARNTVAISQSPFTYSQQVHKWTGQRWEADITLPPMKRADAEEWISFLVSLKGSYGTFY